jgi:hypothetical protein
MIDYFWLILLTIAIVFGVVGYAVWKAFDETNDFQRRSETDEANVNSTLSMRELIDEEKEKK